MSEIYCMVRYPSFPAYYKTIKYGVGSQMERSSVQKRFHTLIASWYVLVNIHFVVLVFKFLTTRIHLYMDQAGSGSQYLSLWNLLFQNVYFMYCVKEEQLVKNDPQKERLQKILAFAFHHVIFPLNFVILQSFWFFWIVDINLLDEHGQLKDILQYANHSAHSFIFPIVMLELFITDRPKGQATFKKVFGCTFLIVFVYLVYVELLYFMYEKRPYPLLGILTYFELTVGVIALCAAATLIWKWSCALNDKISQRNLKKTS